ncbi:MAG: hypothetical protein ACE14T_10330 [Syntrophales bacterium]
MIFYLLLPVFSLILLVLQTTILDLFFLGKMGLEISLVVVIYAGFHLNASRGGILAFVMGFLLDCITGSITGLFTFFYVVVFFSSKIVSFRVYAEGLFFIMFFTLVCALSEGVFIMLLYRLIYGVDISTSLFRLFIPQALVAGVLSPALFAFFDRFKVLRDVTEQ